MQKDKIKKEMHIKINRALHALLRKSFTFFLLFLFWAIYLVPESPNPKSVKTIKYWIKANEKFINP
jgi:hypothetical protein